MPGMAKIRYTKDELAAMVLANVTKFRKEQGLSQNKLARLAGISVGWINDLERGRRKDCRIGSLARLAAAMGIHPAMFFLPVGMGKEFTKRLTADD